MNALTANADRLAASSIKMSVIVAMGDTTLGIGAKGQIPWSLPDDLHYFARVTSRTADPAKLNAVIMGRKTLSAIPLAYRPLPNRLNCVVSTTLTADTIGEVSPTSRPDSILVCRSFADAVNTVVDTYGARVEHIFAIGGTSIYAEALTFPVVGFLHRLYVTRVFSDVECDAFMQPADFLDSFRRLDEVPDAANFGVEFNVVQTDAASGLQYVFEVYERKP